MMQQKRSDRIEFLVPPGMVESGLVDLSKSGAGYTSHKKIAKDTIGDVVISGLKLKAKVVYCQEKVGSYRIGLRFVNLAPENTKVLDDLVEKFSRGVPLEFNASIQ